MPPWNHVHPLVVHFPLALLLVAPLMVVLGLGLRDRRKGLYLAAVVLLGMGTLGALVALASGEAAASLAERTPELRAALDRHEALAQRAALLWGLLTLAFAFIGLWPLRTPVAERLHPVLVLCWLAFGAWAALTLGRAGQQGGRMVHELGTHALPPDPARRGP